MYLTIFFGGTRFDTVLLEVRNLDYHERKRSADIEVNSEKSKTVRWALLPRQPFFLFYILN